ncbi:hypothetical protein SFRURICE_000251 [Spodoptera frugiperda]|nr:hypothetical protein SFRURICE_000251 [Spodoptera frugiperda]
MDGFEVLLESLEINCDVIVLTECWLSSQTANLPSLDGYCTHKTNSNMNQNDGVVVYIKNNLKVLVEEPRVQK